MLEIMETGNRVSQGRVAAAPCPFLDDSIHTSSPRRLQILGIFMVFSHEESFSGCWRSWSEEFARSHPRGWVFRVFLMPCALLLGILGLLEGHQSTT